MQLDQVPSPAQPQAGQQGSQDPGFAYQAAAVLQAATRWRCGLWIAPLCWGKGTFRGLQATEGAQTGRRALPTSQSLQT